MPELDERPVLLYRATCTKCRRLSRLAVLLSLGQIRRLANDDPAALAVLRERGLAPTKVILLTRKRTVVGWRVLPHAAASTAACLRYRLR